MNKLATNLTPEAEVASPLEPLQLLRRPFPEHHISKLPKETGAQAKQRKADQDAGKWPTKCAVCEGYHHPKAVHLDYVGHAAATDRLLDADIRWTWEPLAYTPEGLPAFDSNGGLWIKLTVDGVTRIGYGAADGKSGGDAIKEIIGDALRNAGMRFGMALDLWHKGQLHIEEPEAPAPSMEERAIAHLKTCAINRAMYAEAWVSNKDNWKAMLDAAAWARVTKAMKEIAATIPADEPAPPPSQPQGQAAKADDFGLDGDDLPNFE